MVLTPFDVAASTESNTRTGQLQWSPHGGDWSQVEALTMFHYFYSPNDNMSSWWIMIEMM
jgi:hypothetical protein